MGGKSQLFGRGFFKGFAGLVCSAAIAPLALAQAAGAVTSPASIVVGGLPDQVPMEILLPPADVVVRVKAPPAGKRHAAAAAGRTEMGRQMMVATSATQRHGAEIVVPYAGGPLPVEALAAPANTLVLLEYLPARAGATAPEAARPAASVSAADVDLVLEYSGGPLPEEAISPPPDTVVGLLAPSQPADDEARASVADPSADIDAAFVVDVPYAARALAADLLDPPLDTVIRLAAPLAGDTVESAVPQGDAPRAAREIVVPYRAGKLPKIALAPPPGTVIKLRAP